jgi:hypothetical protein
MRPCNLYLFQTKPPGSSDSSIGSISLLVDIPLRADSSSSDRKIEIGTAVEIEDDGPQTRHVPLYTTSLVTRRWTTMPGSN